MGEFTPLHLVKIPLRPERLTRVASWLNIPLRDADDAYLAHLLMRELWQSQAPAPFVLRDENRVIQVWGYSAADAQVLIHRARAGGDPALLEVIADVEQIVSAPVPPISSGQRVRFTLRACPVIRLAHTLKTIRAGAEVDAFQVHCLNTASPVVASREDVYREWLLARLTRDTGGVAPTDVRVTNITRRRLVRPGGGSRGPSGGGLPRPDVTFVGELIVVDAASFQSLLARGIGRHRAFGFGALMLVKSEVLDGAANVIP